MLHVPPSHQALRALLVEHLPAVGAAIEAYLSTVGVAVFRQARGDHALNALGALAPDFVVIDAQSPGIGATEFCRQLRGDGHSIPIVVLAPEADVFEEIIALEVGADDYLPRDVPGRLLWARVKAARRRAALAISPFRSSDDLMQMGRYVFDRRAREIRGNGKAVELSAQEFNCVWLLAKNAGVALTREEIRSALYIKGRSVDMHICRLRQKLDGIDPALNRIRSIRSIGYVFSPVALNHQHPGSHEWN
jgi:two-component system response regulator RstA